MQDVGRASLWIQKKKVSYLGQTFGQVPQNKPVKRQRRSIETKEKIYQAALQAINEHGFENVSIEDITTAAHVAKGTFYVHFDSKESIIHYTFQHADQIYQQAYEQVRGRDFLYMISKFMRLSYIEHEKKGKGIIKAFVTRFFSIPGREFLSKDRAVFRCLTEIIEQGKREQIVDEDIPTDKLVETIFLTMIGVEVMWCYDEQGRHLADMMEESVLLVAKGMLL